MEQKLAEIDIMYLPLISVDKSCRPLWSALSWLDKVGGVGVQNKTGKINECRFEGHLSKLCVRRFSGVKSLSASSPQVTSVHLNHWKLDRRLGLGLLFLYAIFLLCSILFGQMWGLKVKGHPLADDMLSTYLSTTRPLSWSQKQEWQRCCVLTVRVSVHLCRIH